METMQRSGATLQAEDEIIRPIIGTINYCFCQVSQLFTTDRQCAIRLCCKSLMLAMPIPATPDSVMNPTPFLSDGGGLGHHPTIQKGIRPSLSTN